MLDGFGLYPSEIIIDLDSYAGPSNHVRKFENRRGWLVAAELSIESEGELYNYQILAACDEYGNSIKSFQAAHLTECGCSFPKLCEEVPPAELNDIVAEEVEWMKRRWLREADADMRDLYRANEALILQLEHQLDRHLKNLDRQISDLRRLRRMGEASSDDGIPYRRLIAECEARQDLELSEFKAERQRIRHEFAELEKRALSKLRFKTHLDVHWLVNWKGAKRSDYQADQIVQTVLSYIEAYNDREGSFRSSITSARNDRVREQDFDDDTDKITHEIRRRKTEEQKRGRKSPNRERHSRFDEVPQASQIIFSNSIALAVDELAALPIEEDPMGQLIALAEQGDADAQFSLGMSFAHGDGVEQDYAEAFRWYKMAAEQGNSDAWCNLGVLYHNGEGVAQNLAEAFRCYLISAEQGNSNAQWNLGVLYDNGEGVDQDDKAALNWYRLAAGQGDPDAQFQAGQAYDYGLGVASDWLEAVTWYRRAAEQEHLDAQFRLYELLKALKSLPDSALEANVWLAKASDNGHPEAQSILQALALHSAQAAALPEAPSTEGVVFQPKRANAEGAGHVLLSHCDDEIAGKMYIEMPRCPCCNQKINEPMQAGQQITCPSCNERWVTS